jgi:hypothetical protein
LEESELAELEKALPIVWDELSDACKEVINKQGVAYRDADGDLVVVLSDGGQFTLVGSPSNSIAASSSVGYKFLKSSRSVRPIVAPQVASSRISRPRRSIVARKAMMMLLRVSQSVPSKSNMITFVSITLRIPL